MSAQARHLPFAALNEAVSKSLTFADLALVRQRLKSAPLLPEERDLIAHSVMLREQFIIHLHTPSC